VSAKGNPEACFARLRIHSNCNQKERDVANFRPLGDRVLVKRVKEEEKSKGGIIIPDTAKEKPQEGEVVAVGPGGRDEDGERIALDVEVGDRVLFGKWSGSEVTVDGDELLIMKESDILGVLEVKKSKKDKAA
jgi:chaperonin GroES